MFDPIEEALEDLKQGHIVIVCDDETRENEGDFVVLAEKATPETINFMTQYGRGLVCVPIEEDLAARLELHPMVAWNSDRNHTAFTVSIDHESTETGISAYERSATILNMLKPEESARGFKRPGHIFPLIAKNGGVLEREGHTEAAVDLAKLCEAKPAGVICEIMNEDGTMARVPELRRIANQFGLKMITIKDLIQYRQQKERLISREVDIQLPTEFGNFKAIGYSHFEKGKEPMALVKGTVDTGEPVLVRLHSECLTGDVFGSYRCDCGPQLHAALREIDREGKGVLVYLRQEGRGIGLLNKLKAYKLQEAGLDTVQANQHLGFADDLRDYKIGAEILKDLGVSRVKLLTNNPRKIEGLQQYGVEVTERAPLQMEAREENEKYLKTKEQKLGHLFHY
ncbi:3,4-dihydroxy 2-butanone 4-phosphate synthase/GTP cyclohydrolase II [Pullulanibacillus pueri]|uniref:Riboflavin biosynthesis protein RibBA n=1 Tax=Pullulanibacillus pueri TaxID=1437324 RepID=A0A8J2ZSV6_9BACL|nr:bifunctional 3,4-dihydroxy-2-butanone-4-phosphate synthase/GTP cyclohydrolase II [Pullulanibacillus pueri]MBM7680270.1 3,4-dihydroxy 2-butanone 4-phosphate synthase/GTP cyclohydrolase II [Pullulanibacillus pueri]GGH75921.1 riboflavin biosynthesis protein RibBA [Pullulanibacillus pueri]